MTAYNPVNLCVSQGDYVAFNEEGGFVGHSYQSGVPYRVLGRVADRVERQAVADHDGLDHVGDGHADRRRDE